MSTSTKTLKASCHCHATQFTITLPVTSLPLKIHLCHCTICRYVHGAPCCFHSPLPPGVDLDFIAPSSKESLTSYTHPSFQSRKWFCKTCGCHIGDSSLTGDVSWTISTAVYDANAGEKGVWRFNSHMCPGSTGDGGLSGVFGEVEGVKLGMWDVDLPATSTATATAGRDDAGTRIATAIPAEESHEDKLNTKPDPEDKLLAQCHCGGVSFHISRPRESFINSPASQNWLFPLDKTRWLASLDVCDDCRLTTGTNVIGWMFVPTDHISPALPSNLLVGTSKAYHSTEDVARTFCGTCGATVFYWCKERPEIVDVATGLLRAPEGVMAEKWAIWRAGRLGWPENGLRYHEGFTRALMEGMKRWGKERGHPEEFVVP
ncbi:uncharacterized protein N7496_000440 [Penicillium cataractarum]|uniref:CENP-V/GFA domain-containing protein n=1 Tax=Penicillium cataractarum TaxID=2100454 RepID=A0A9W9VU09_9EURO|nr:uncharacterized protein N7496_000440 [Penicillium cataractarum]KAJ5389372.1 hypothetical protein N7496_000440 [Penicillium cataractarum]